MGKKVSCKYSLGTIIKAPLWHVSVDIYFPLTEDQNYSLIIHRVLKRYSVLFKKSLTGLQEKSTKLPSTLIRQRAASGERRERKAEQRQWQGCHPRPGWGTHPGSPFCVPLPREEDAQPAPRSGTAVCQAGISMGDMGSFPWAPQQAELSSWLRYIPLKSQIGPFLPIQTPFPKAQGRSFNTTHRHWTQAESRDKKIPSLGKKGGKGFSPSRDEAQKRGGLCRDRAGDKALSLMSGALSRHQQPLAPVNPGSIVAVGIFQNVFSGLCGHELNRTLEFAVL